MTDHHVPTHREVVISAIDKRYSKVDLATMLRLRGIDPDQPYEKVSPEGAEDDVYMQAIPPEQGSSR